VKLASLALVLLLSACGGGSGGNAPAPVVKPQPVPVSRSAPLRLGYYGAVRDAGAGKSSTAETADHISFVWTGPWGDWTTAEGRADIALDAEDFLHEASELGVDNAIVDVSFTLWIAAEDNLPAGYRGTVELHQFLTTLRNDGLAPMVRALYLQDEPELYGITDAMYCRAATDARAVLAQFPEFHDVKIAVVYSDNFNKLPGIGCVDIAGFDAYGTNIFAGKYDEFTARLRPDQQTLLLAGGSDPWRANLDSFYSMANADERVYAIVGFVWWDHWEPTHPDWHGIRSNGMACSYRAMGLRIKGLTPATCKE
jgi:hypothetical protein